MMDTEGNALAARGVLLPAGPPKLEGLEGDAHLHGTRRRSEM